MKCVVSAMQYRRLHAPKNHGERLIEPPLSDVPEKLALNRELAGRNECALQGRSLGALSAAARSGVVDAAIKYTSRYRNVDNSLADAAGPIVMTGHQPELYHPGVWFKNFILDRIAREQNAVGINLLIDNDTIRQAAIRVPIGSVDKPGVEWIAFDRLHDELPYEERQLVDPALFGTFSERVRSKLIRSIQRPLIEQLWPRAVAATRINKSLGSCISQARHQLEATWGLKTLELPLSQVCDGEPFRWFAVTIFSRLTEFRRIYNESLLEYRRVNRVRSHTHPVPRLASDAEWLEAPFWLWSSANPKRRRLFVRTTGDGIEITDRQSERHQLSISPDGSCEASVEQLKQLSDQGFKLRSRALLTTMFARLFLCDLFVHGIGGGKYDQLTDAVIERFFGVSAPGFLTVTATARLPIEHRNTLDSEILTCQLKLRELQFNPQRLLASMPEAAELVTKKQRLISETPRADQRRERHLQIAQVNDAMQPMVESLREDLLRKRAHLMERDRINKLLGSREYSFVLFPESTLRPLPLDI